MMKKVIIFTSNNFSLKVLSKINKKLLNKFDVKIITNNNLDYKTEIYSRKTIYKCDLLISIGFTEKINLANISSTFGSFNIHQSILPEYRGRHPVQAMIINGETTYGCTLHVLDNNFDTGNIVKYKIKKFKNVPNEFTVRKLIIFQTAYLLEYLLLHFEEGFKTKKQKSKAVNFAPRRTPEDSLISPNLDYKTIKNMTKALMKSEYRPFIIIDSQKIFVKDIFLYNLNSKNLLEYKLDSRNVYLEEYKSK